MPIINNFPSGGAKKALLQSKEIIPTKEDQTVVPDEGYDGLSDVEVSAIPDEYADVSSVTTTATNVLAGDKFVGSDGVIHEGTMADNEDVDVTLDTENTEYVIPEGKHSGDGAVSILLQEKTAAPSASEQEITPDSGKVLSKVTIAAIDPNLINTTISSNAAAAADIVSPKQAYVNGKLVTGTMVDNGTVTKTLDASTTSYTIPAGKHSGTGKVSITTQTKIVTPSTSQQPIYPDSGKVLSGVTVNAMSTGALSTPSISVDPSTGVITATSGVSTSGYISSGTTKSNTYSMSTQVEKIVTPSTSTQTAVSSGRYTTGTVYVAGDSNLVASNIKSGTSIFGVTGTYTGSGGSGTLGSYIRALPTDRRNITFSVSTSNLVGFVFHGRFTSSELDGEEIIVITGGFYYSGTLHISYTLTDEYEGADWFDYDENPSDVNVTINANNINIALSGNYYFHSTKNLRYYYLFPIYSV